MMNKKSIIKLSKQVWKYKKELFPPFSKRSNELLKRFWRIHISPPAETRQFIDLGKFEENILKLESVKTDLQPKQVAVSEDKNTAFVSCMEGKKIQIFSISPKLKIIDEIPFSQQCVEIVIKGNICFVTTTDFKSETSQENLLWIIDVKLRKIISSTPTGGNWSKIIAITPDESQVLISNWKSNSISVIDIKDLKAPKFIQSIEIKKCPRGIAFTKDGKTAIVTLFHSGNIAELSNKKGKWEVAFVSRPFDEPRYPGNPRHVIISSDDRFAYISNQGRSVIHKWNIAERTWETTYPVGRGPKTIDFLEGDESKALVTCSGGDRVCILDLESGKIVGVSQKTGALTTGLCLLSKSDFFVTGFEDATLERFTISPKIYRSPLILLKY